MDKSLLDAINSIGDKRLVEYWEGTNNDQIKQDIQTLMSVHADKGGPGFILPGGLQEQPMQLTKLEAFTMAAMQGLCVAFGKEIAMQDYATLLATDAIDVAKATLSELSKQQ